MAARLIAIGGRGRIGLGAREIGQPDRGQIAGVTRVEVSSAPGGLIPEVLRNSISL